MKSKDIKKKIKASLRSSKPYQRLLNGKIDRKVIREFLSFVKTLDLTEVSLDIIKIDLQSSILASGITNDVNKLIMRMEKEIMKDSSSYFLSQLDRVKKGKKKLQGASYIIANKTHLKNFHLPTSKRNLSFLIANELEDIRQDIALVSGLTEDGIIKKLNRAIDKVDFTKQRKTTDSLIRELKVSLRKETKKITSAILANRAAEASNRGDLLAAKSSGIKMVKKWITRFDSKTRNWHDKVNSQTRELEDYFEVPHPKGVDFLKAPKIPPISPANYFNCRCVVAYKALK